MIVNFFHWGSVNVSMVKIPRIRVKVCSSVRREVEEVVAVGLAIVHCQSQGGA